MTGCRQKFNGGLQQEFAPLRMVFYASILLCLCFVVKFFFSASDGGLVPLAKLNPNTASVAQLAQLPSIGEKKAQAIVDCRNKEAFEKPEDMEKTPGIGPKTVEKLKPWLVFNN